MYKHLEREKDEDIRAAKTESKVDFLEEMVKDLKEGQHDIFKLLSDMKNLMIQERRK